MITKTATDRGIRFREELILEQLPQVKLIAVRIHRGVPPSVPVEDLVSAGMLGLISAIDHYDPLHGVKLKTYAEHKIRGAILDSLRLLDWAPRQKRRRAKMIENAIGVLQKKLGRAPMDEEIACELALSLVQYQDWQAETGKMTVASLEPGDAEKGGPDLLRFVFVPEDRWPSCIFERAELERLLTRALTTIPRTEQTVLALYYYEELTLREIAQVVGVHESRVSQLKSQAILRLRAQLQGHWPEHGSLTARQQSLRAA